VSPDAPAAGRFITFEGPEGSGKSTQVALLAERLASRGLPVEVTREPGGTAVGERIRGVLLDPATGDVLPETEALLFNAARYELVSTVVRPALEAGRIVLCDRYADATLAYQGHGRGVAPDWLARLNDAATGGLDPDLTVLLDLPVDTGLARRRGEGSWNRIDAADLEFHERVRAGYLELARSEPWRWVVVRADRSPDQVAEDIERAVTELLDG